jgi:hypothetical protein
MSPHREVEKILKAELDIARARFERVQAEFESIMSDVPDGIPEPDSALRFRNAGRARSAAHEAVAAALQRFSDFTLRGIVPDHLKERVNERSMGAGQGGC